MAQSEMTAGDADASVENAGEALDPIEDLARYLDNDDEEEEGESESDEAQGKAEGAEGEEDEGADEPDEPAIEPPHSWKADAKDAFKTLPPELQKIVSERETERDRFVQQKAQEAAGTRQTVENEARAVIAQLQQQTARELQQYAAMITPQAPDPASFPDWQTYSQAKSVYDHAVAQRNLAQQQAQEYEAAAKAQQDHIRSAEMQAEVDTLRTAFPEWFDPSDGAKVQQELTSIARELGYSEDHVGQARAVDVLAMRKAAEWKAKADRWDAANKAKMANVRAAKDLPKVTKPGVARGAPSREAKADAAWQNVKTARGRDAKANAFADFLEASGHL